MAYLLDANVFIAAKQLHYGFDFCPAFWDRLVASHRAGLVHSIEKVGDELAAGGDELSGWAAERGPSFFRRPEAAVLRAMADVSTWAYGQSYTDAAVSTFLQIAYYYLVSDALARDDTVVTHEVTSASTRKIKIPDACISLGIKCMTPYEMLRRERARFVLGGDV